MEIEEMIEEINKFVDDTLSITHYYTAWELHSYKENSLFSEADKYVHAQSFKDLIKEAYRIVKKAELPEEEQDITMKVI